MVYPILSVTDVDTSLAFYTEKLGFQQDLAMDGPDGKTAFAFVRLGTEVVGFSRADTDNVGRGVVFMFAVPEGAKVDTVYAEVQAKGVAIEEPIKTEYWGDRIFSIKDPDGYYLTLYETIHQPDMEHIEKVMKGEVQPE
jgi:uncharacterized glyoxalase superfamily protein PhnB